MKKFPEKGGKVEKLVQKVLLQCRSMEKSESPLDRQRIKRPKQRKNQAE